LPASMSIPVSKLKPSQFRLRSAIDEQGVEELASSIKSKGIIQPLLVRPIRTSSYEIVVGERRFLAGQKAGLTEFPCLVQAMSDEDALARSLIENLQREDLTDYEKGKIFHEYRAKFGKTYEEIGELIGKDRQYVGHHVSHFRFLESMKPKLSSRDDKGFEEAQRKLTEGHTRAILSVQDEKQRESLADQVITLGRSVRETESLVKRALEPKVEKNTEPKMCDLETVAYNFLDLVRQRKDPLMNCNSCPGRDLCAEVKSRIIELGKALSARNA